jgi:hypothetical protein
LRVAVETQLAEQPCFQRGKNDRGFSACDWWYEWQSVISAVGRDDRIDALGFTGYARGLLGLQVREKDYEVGALARSRKHVVDRFNRINKLEAARSLPLSVRQTDERDSQTGCRAVFLSSRNLQDY